MMIKQSKIHHVGGREGDAYLVPSPEGMSHDVDDGTETADPLVVAVHPMSPVVVVLSTNLNGCGGSNVTNYVIAGQIKSIDGKDENKNAYHILNLITN